MSGVRARDAGFTLVELLLASALFALATVALLTQLTAARRAQVAGERAIALQQSTRAGLDRLAELADRPSESGNLP